MKLDIKTDFTKLPRAEKVLRSAEVPANAAPASGTIALAHDERHLRRKVLALTNGDKVLVDLLQPVELRAGDRLVMEDNSTVEIADADEELIEVTGRDAAHLIELGWHIGNHHLAVDITAERILILRESGMADELRELGAQVREIAAPFHPLANTHRGHGHVHAHDHGHHHHDHDHGHDHHHHHDHGPNCGCGHHH
ncbi:urease accessory protein UreE [Aminobacter sp. J44]|uniref:urease accessory protein UreE n=1 Tax=Aminobacter sp. J44 TaxID=935262 RepID=UPI0011A28C5A|nr:urease accessory protein UreE [Aminobacter sp. J44]